jgi:hypothetical protein
MQIDMAMIFWGWDRDGMSWFTARLEMEMEMRGEMEGD